MISAINRFFKAEKKWKVEMYLLQSILLECKLTETYNGCIPVIPLTEQKNNLLPENQELINMKMQS